MGSQGLQYLIDRIPSVIGASQQGSGLAGKDTEMIVRSTPMAFLVRPAAVSVRRQIMFRTEIFQNLRGE